MGNENKKTASMTSNNPRSNSARGNETTGQINGTSQQQQQQQANNLQLSPSFDSIPPWNTPSPMMTPAPATPSFSTHTPSFMSPSPFSPLTLPNAGFLTTPLTSMPFTFPPIKLGSPMPPPPPPPPIFHRSLFEDFEFGRYRPRHYCCTNYCSHDFHYPHLPLNSRPHASTRHHVNHSTHHHHSNTNSNSNNEKKTIEHKHSHHQSNKQQQQQQQPLRIVCRNS